MYDLNKELRQGDFEVMFFIMVEQMKKDLEKWQQKVEFYNDLNDRLHTINANNDLSDEQFDNWVVTYDRLTERINNACENYKCLERYIKRIENLSSDIVTLYSEIRPEW